MLTKEQIKTAAEKLYQAEKDCTQIPALTLEHPDMTMDDAYAVQKTWLIRRSPMVQRLKVTKLV